MRDRLILDPVNLVGALVGVFVLGAAVSPPAAGEDITGARIIELCESDSASDLALCHGFFRGLSDTHSIYAAMGKGLHLYCLPRGVTQEQFERVAFKWMDANAEALQRPAAVLIVQAMHEGFPCTAEGKAVEPEPEQSEGPAADLGGGDGAPGSDDG